MKSAFRLCGLKTGWLRDTVLTIGLIASTAQAQSGSETASLFGQLGQLNVGVTAFSSTACGPTAVANGLVYLNSAYGGNLFQNYNPNSYTTVNDLISVMGTSATGTSYGTANPSLVSGLYSYIGASGLNPAPNVYIAGGQYSVGTGASIPPAIAGSFASVIPTAQTMANWLNANDAVEFMIQWGTYGGAGGTTWTPSGNQHFATLTSLSLASGSGTLNFLDPWGSSAVLSTANVQTIGGYLYLYDIMGDISDPESTLSESGGDTGDGPDLATLPSGRIVADLAEAVPEPGVLALATLSCGWLVIGLRRKTPGRGKT